MIQLIPTDYDFRKTYYRNFYDNRKAGLVSGSRLGKLSRVTHHTLAAIDPNDDADEINRGQLWNEVTEQWEDSNEPFVAAVDIQQNFADPEWTP